MKYVITIKRIFEEEFEMILENESVMRAFDEARDLVIVRNQKNKIGQFFVTKVNEVKEEENATSSSIPEE